MIKIYPGPYQDQLHRYNVILDLMSEARELAKQCMAPQVIRDQILVVESLVYYEAKKIEAVAAPTKDAIDG